MYSEDVGMHLIRNEHVIKFVWPGPKPEQHLMVPAAPSVGINIIMAISTISSSFAIPHVSLTGLSSRTQQQACGLEIRYVLAS